MLQNSKLIVAKAFSLIFIPHLSLLYLLIAYMYFNPIKNLFIALSVVFLFYYLIPITILLLYSKKLNKTIDEMTGRERIPVIFVGFLLYLLAYLIFIYTGEYSMAKITLFLLIFTTVFGLFSLFTKPSFHTGAFSGGVTYLALLFDIRILALLVITPIIGWSRIVLGAHTRNQVILGTILGISLAGIFSLIL